jgi:hypothetical protein
LEEGDGCGDADLEGGEGGLVVGEDLEEMGLALFEKKEGIG